MGASNLLRKIKDVFGLTETSGSSGDEEPHGMSPDVTVERDIESETEMETASEFETETEGETEEVETVETEGETTESGTDETEPETEPAETPTETPAETPAETAEPATDSEPVTDVKGIGSTYGDRLEAAGIGTVEQLANSDAETVAETAETSESRASDWIERARNRSDSTL